MRKTIRNSLCTRLLQSLDKKRLNMEKYCDELEDNMKEMKLELKQLTTRCDDLKERRELAAMGKADQAAQKENLGALYMKLLVHHQDIKGKWLVQGERRQYFEHLAATRKRHLEDSAERLQEAMESNRQAFADAREAWTDERATFLEAIKAAKV